MCLNSSANLIQFQNKNTLVQQETYSNENISKNEKIDAEKRRRNQVYKKLDYLLSNITYFDFFSADAFAIIKSTKKIAEFYKTKKISIELLFLGLIYSKTEIAKLLNEYGINKENFGDFIQNLKKNSTKEIKVNFSFFKKFEEKNINNTIEFSTEISLLLEKAAENALKRFKTPIITSEILFLTIIEQKNSKLIKLMKSSIGNDLNWELLRYKIIKRIHKEESSIRDEIRKNQYYFGYLLKTQLKDMEFDRLITNELLNEGVELFRNTLISNLLEINMVNVLNSDIYKSIKITSERIYS
jgi:hypothetical protein